MSQVLELLTQNEELGENAGRNKGRERRDADGEGMQMGKKSFV